MDTATGTLAKPLGGAARPGRAGSRFSFPVVPRGEDRVHTRMSEADDLEEPGRAITTFAEIGRELGVIA